MPACVYGVGCADDANCYRLDFCSVAFGFIHV